MYICCNANPDAQNVGDCTIRAISCALGRSWEDTYIDLCIQGYLMADMPSANHVWGTYLRRKGFKCNVVDPSVHTVRDFCDRHGVGTYILALDGHVVCVKGGDWIDTWDSGNKAPIYFWCKE